MAQLYSLGPSWLRVVCGAGGGGGGGGVGVGGFCLNETIQNMINLHVCKYRLTIQCSS